MRRLNEVRVAIAELRSEMKSDIVIDDRVNWREQAEYRGELLVRVLGLIDDARHLEREEAFVALRTEIVDAVLDTEVFDVD